MAATKRIGQVPCGASGTLAASRLRDAILEEERLRALGLQPIAAEPSLGQRRQKLQRLKRQNVAAIAAFRRTVPEVGGNLRGTPLARRRPRRGDD